MLSAVAAAAWLTQATLALTDAGAGSDRVALLPTSPLAIGGALLAGILALAAIRRGAAPVALAPLALCVLPWLPGDVPSAFLLWTGPAALLPWVAASATAAAALWRRGRWHLPRPPIVAGTAACAVFGIAAWSVAPNVPGGDEPHYLIITQSLLRDGDLKIENNHRQGEYRAYFAGELRPDFLRRSRNGEIYSIHAPGLPALIAPAFALGGYYGVVLFLILLSALGSALAWHVAWLHTRRRDAAWFGWAAVTLPLTTVFHSFSVYPDGAGGVIVLTGVWALLRAGSLRGHGEHRDSNREGSLRGHGEHRDSNREGSLRGHGEHNLRRNEEPPRDREAHGSYAPATARSWLLHGAALALLPWLHSRFALLAGTLGIAILVRLLQTRQPMKNSAAFLAVPLVSCAGWLAYFIVIYGVADPSAPYGGEIGSTAYIGDGLAGLFFDQRFGLLTYAPVLAFALAGFAAMRSRFAFELLLVVVPYLLIVTNFRMWWAGWSAPARFAVPILFLLAVPAAAAWSATRRRGTRATGVGLLLLTTLTTATVVLVENGTLAYNVRTAPSLWIGWLARNADLVNALPAWSDREPEFFRDIAVWCAAVLAAWALVRGMDRLRPLRTRAALATTAIAIFCMAAMTAATLVWRVRGLDGRAPVSAQLELLRAAAATRAAIGIGVQPPRTIAQAALPAQLRIRPELLPAPEDTQAGDVLLAALPAVPAGEYRLRAHVRGSGGRLRIGIGRDNFAVHESALGSSGPMVLRLPVDVRALLVRGDEKARRTVRGVTIEPLSLVPAGDRLTQAFATHVVRYGGHTVFFLDDRSFPEADAFWIGGARETTLVLLPDTARGRVSLLVRNAPVRNQLIIQSGAWRDVFEMQPGEERRIDVPLDTDGKGALLRFSVASGFRPSELDPANADQRYLGVWLKPL